MPSGQSRTERDALQAAYRLVGLTPSRELVPHDPRHSVRWHQHDYPSPLSRWNYHPELEIHLIRHGTGRFIVGDRIDTFGPGHLVLVGPNLPHDWISDVPSGESLEGRDVVVQFREEWLRKCQEVLPELDALDDLLADSVRGLEFRGATAGEAARHLELVGTSEGAARIQHLFGLLNALATGPEHERRPLAREWFMPQGDQRVVDVMDIALTYILENIAGDLQMRVLAERVGMSESGFSKYFLKASNMTFTEMVRGLRLSQACRMLARDEGTIASISQQVGYSNLSNFNRQFMREHGMTPSAFRRRERNAPVNAASGG